MKHVFLLFVWIGLLCVGFAHMAQAANVTINNCAELQIVPTTITAGTNAAMKATITVQNPPNCTATAIQNVNAGFQWKVDAGLPVACAAGAFVDVPGSQFQGGTNFGTTDASGQVSRTFLTTGLGGKTIGFRARHDTESQGSPPNQTTWPTSNSGCIDLVINEGGFACPTDFHGAVIWASKVTGDGSPPAGAVGPWAFRISVKACGGDVMVKSAQGGTSGWTNFVSAVPNWGDAAIRELGGSKAKKNEKTGNKVILWDLKGVVLGQGSTKYLDVTVDGQIPASAPDGQIRCLSGPWSALYSIDEEEPFTYVKSEYTGRVAIEVDNDGSSGTDPAPAPVCSSL
jgi:hypothetical protein